MGLDTLLGILVAHPVVFVILLLILLAVSIFGNIGIDIKGRKITFGFQKKDLKRTCNDCITLLLSKRTIYEARYNTKRNNILRDQMNYAEHKLQEVKFYLLSRYQNNVIFGGPLDMYKELLINSMNVVKDEIRRSFKENGFHELEEKEFGSYLKDRVVFINTIIKDYFSPFNYPQIKDVSNPDIDIHIRDIYSKAKDIINDAERDLLKYQEDFINDVEGIAGDRYEQGKDQTTANN